MNRAVAVPDPTALVSMRLIGQVVHRGIAPLEYRNGDLDVGPISPKARLMVLATEPRGVVKVEPGTTGRLSSVPVTE